MSTRLVSLALLIAAWYAGSQLAGARLLPDPQAVALAIVDEALSGALAFNLGATLARVAVAFIIAMTLGSVIGAWTRLRHVILPQLAPYLAAAARSGLSLVWKIVLIVELLGRPNGVGFEIGVAFQLFDVTRILAYALAFIAVMLAIETFLVQPLERHVARWRPRPA